MTLWSFNFVDYKIHGSKKTHDGAEGLSTHPLMIFVWSDYRSIKSDSLGSVAFYSYRALYFVLRRRFVISALFWSGGTLLETQDYLFPLRSDKIYRWRNKILQRRTQLNTGHRRLCSSKGKLKKRWLFNKHRWDPNCTFLKSEKLRAI